MEKESKHNFRESGYIYGLLYRHLRGKHEKSIRRNVVKYAFNIYFDFENMQSFPNWGKRIPGVHDDCTESQRRYDKKSNICIDKVK